MRGSFLLLAVLLSSVGIVGAQTPPPEFKNPPSAYRPSPLWSWNAALDDAELRWQVREFKEKGYGGFFMHSRVGLTTRYLSDDWFRKVRVSVEQARALGLEAWLYDEDKWPSGFAGGFTTHGHPEYTAMGMGYKKVLSADVPKALADPQTLAVFEVKESGFRRVQGGETVAGEAWQFLAQPYQPTNWYNGETYVDTLNPDAIAYFLKLTFADGYDRRFLGEYGTVVPGVFTDEPNYQAGRGRDRTIFPWTARFPEIFREKRGYDLVEQLPLLLLARPGFEQVRYDFWRTAAEQFETAFSKQYGELAGKLGLKLTGHYLAEDTLSSQTQVTGSVMLNYVHQQMPGIDHLQRNIANALTKKQASSVAHQFGRERVLSEIYGVSGHTASFEDLKWVADDHFALGVNFLCPHLVLYTMTGDRKRDYPPTFSYHQPYWPWMKTLNDYLGRAAWFVTRGKPQQQILLLEPLGSAWAHYAPGGPKPEAVASLEKRFANTFDALLAGHRDFDLGDEILLERHGRAEKGELRVGPEGHYKVVIVPPAFRWNQATRDLLDKFLGENGKVVFRGAQPGSLQGLLPHPNASDIEDDDEEMARALDKLLPRDISIADNNGNEIGDVLYQHRFDGTRHYFFLANKSRTEAYHPVIKVQARGSLVRWDLAAGTTEALADGFALPPAGSLAFTVEPGDPPRSQAKPVNGAVNTFSGPFAFKRLQPNALVLDTCRYSINGSAEQGPVSVWKVRQEAFSAAGLGAFAGLQPWALEWKGIQPDKTARVKMTFEFQSELDRPTAWLVVEKPEDFEITFNGQPAGPAEGWQWDKQFRKLNVGGRVRHGVNRIELATVYKPGVEIEDVFITGDFAAKKLSDTVYALAAEPAQLGPGDWVQQGYHFYSGNMAYQLALDYRPGEDVTLRLKQPAGGTAYVVRVNQKEVATLGWQPWEARLTPSLKAGRNAIEIVVLSSLQNTFGPLHNDMYRTAGNNWWFGPNAFNDQKHWTDAYYHAPYGLGEVEVIRSRAKR